MLRSHVEHEFVGVEEGLILGIKIEIVDHSGSALTGLCVAIISFEVGHGVAIRYSLFAIRFSPEI